MNEMTENLDERWVERARQREPSAVSELYRRYGRAARAAGFGVTGDMGLAEDAASEALWVAMDALESLRDTRRFGPWLRTIVIRTAHRLKKQSRECTD